MNSSQDNPINQEIEIIGLPSQYCQNEIEYMSPFSDEHFAVLFQRMTQVSTKLGGTILNLMWSL